MSDTDVTELDEALAIIDRFRDALFKYRNVYAAADAAAHDDLLILPPIDLTARLAPYHAATEDVPRDVVCAVLKAVAQCDLSKVKPLLGNLRSELTLADDAEFMFGPDVGDELAEANANAIISRLCDLIVAEDVWPQQVKR